MAITNMPAPCGRLPQILDACLVTRRIHLGKTYAPVTDVPTRTPYDMDTADREITVSFTTDGTHEAYAAVADLTSHAHGLSPDECQALDPFGCPCMVYYFPCVAYSYHDRSGVFIKRALLHVVIVSYEHPGETVPYVYLPDGVRIPEDELALILDAFGDGIDAYIRGYHLTDFIPPAATVLGLVPANVPYDDAWALLDYRTPKHDLTGYGVRERSDLVAALDMGMSYDIYACCVQHLVGLLYRC